ncbi:GNAT family N-acetyltransferase [Streptomyces sp. NPDC001668]|uniref:GNAT family N-acetyltransferase n=1 Tax=unclassified Streptomyces TaxID=2593676 RepID=UPI0036A1582B
MCRGARPEPSNRHVAEDTVSLSPTCVGRGPGTKLLEELVKASAGCGLHQMIAVIADTGDGASTALHRRVGFQYVGRLTAVGHKDGRWLDTILMQRDLITDATP